MGRMTKADSGWRRSRSGGTANRSRGWGLGGAGTWGIRIGFVGAGAWFRMEVWWPVPAVVDGAKVPNLPPPTITLHVHDLPS
jgi:hypothetical protein